MNLQLFNMINSQYAKKTLQSSNGILAWTDGAHCHLPSLKFYGETKTYGAPTPDAPILIRNFAGYYSFEDGGTSVPLICGIGDCRDEWDYVTGKGIRRVKEIVLDGEVNKMTSAGSKNAYLALTEPVIKSGATYIKCTHYASKWDTNHGSTYTNDCTSIRFYDNRGLTLANWNDWLKEQYDAGTPVTVYYALAQPQPFEERVEAYKPIANDNGRIAFADGTFSPTVPFEITYITHP